MAIGLDYMPDWPYSHDETHFVSTTSRIADKPSIYNANIQNVICNLDL